jgi:MarR family transcriptional repressor of emrRAB
MRGIERLAAVERSTPAMARALADLPMDETVMVRLLRICVVGLGQFFEPVFREIGLSENSFHVLCLVGTSRANMTRILADLAEGGLITRSGEERDARRAVVSITRRGRQIADDAVPKLREPLLLAFADLTADERAALEALLRKLVRSFDKSPYAFRATA